MATKDANFYLRRTFTPCLILMAGMFLLRVWLDGWWVEYRVGRAIERAASQTTIRARNESLAHVVDLLDGYKRHVAAASALIPRLDTTAIDKVRDDIDWYRLQTASVYQGALEYEHWSSILDDFLTNYELPDLGVMRPAQRRTLTVILWVLAAVTVVTFFIKMSWHEWGEF
ncbi:MAG: hypothetical protein ACE5JM_17120 [Armatimonadota bacterium]